MSAAIGKALGGEAVRGVSVPLSGGDGESTWLDGEVEQLRSASGEVLGTLVSGTDSSAADEAQRKAAEKDLLALLDKVDQALLVESREDPHDAKSRHPPPPSSHHRCLLEPLEIAPQASRQATYRRSPPPLGSCTGGCGQGARNR